MATGEMFDILPHRLCSLHGNAFLAAPCTEQQKRSEAKRSEAKRSEAKRSEAKRRSERKTGKWHAMSPSFCFRIPGTWYTISFSVMMK